ncbi:MAG TPA: inositol monophosphatase family protein [Candidatus Omnitrophota bacterium]|nr:inositol monophosphatase family protein [Candidatus Omnitrophota bacterium]
MDWTKKDFLGTMKEFVFQGGKIALNLMDRKTVSFKKDNSVITDADKSISKLAHRKLKKYLESSEHILIDEEDPCRRKYLNQKFLEKKKYIWAMDPVDGTRLYANQMPLFGISIGLIKDLKPWLGVVYFPSLKELFYCNGIESYFVANAFSRNAQEIKIKKQQEKITSKSLFLLSDLFFNSFSWKQRDCRLLITACAVVDICWPAIGRGVGCFDQSHLWDFTGAWPVARSAGLDFRHWQTAEILDKVDEKFFKKGNKAWQLHDYYLLSTKKNFFELQKRISKKG